MKKPENMVREYVRRLSDEDLKFLNGRLKQRLSNDLTDVLENLARANEIDRWLGNARGSDDLYDMVDVIQGFVEKECTRRYSK
jgi:hypothetical protein